MILSGAIQYFSYLSKKKKNDSLRCCCVFALKPCGTIFVLYLFIYYFLPIKKDRLAPPPFFFFFGSRGKKYSK